MAYQLEGQVIEVCTCKAICPCWIGEEPDQGYCNGVLAYHIKRGAVDGTDVSGRTLAIVAHIPGNALQGNWKVRLFVDEEASAAQKDALVNAWSGKLGGPLADIAKMVGEVTGVEQAPITFSLQASNGSLRVGEAIDAGMTAFRGATGGYTSLHDAVFSTIPGAPAHVGKSTHYRVNSPEFKLDIKDHSAVWGEFRFES